MREDNRKLVDNLMNEHVRFPGFPQIIVPRYFIYEYLRDCGWDVCKRGFGSVDYIYMAARVVDEPLTEESERDRLLASVRSDCEAAA